MQRNLSVQVDPNKVADKRIHALYLLIAMHITGFLGLQASFSQYLFENLVSFNLLIVGILLIYFQENKNRSFYITAFIIALTGFLVEYAGVSSKIIFGDYHYQSSLGIKCFGVPPIIGLNWLILLIASSSIALKISKQLWIRALCTAVLMVFLDFFIEPFAIRHHLWAWNHPSVPLRNYLAWLIISFLLAYFYLRGNFGKNNRLGIAVYLIQLLFFLAHNVTYLIES